MLKLIYWPAIPGRGEFVRLILEDAGVAYEDVGRTEGWEAVRAHLYGAGGGQPAFAPPILLDGGMKLAQMPAICAYLGERHGLAGEGEHQRNAALQLQLTRIRHHLAAARLFPGSTRPPASLADTCCIDSVRRKPCEARILRDRLAFW